MEKSKRRIIFIGSLMTALLVWLCPWGSIVANATGDFSDYDYYGRIDSFTGEPINDTITDGDNTIITDSSRKYITGNEYYDYDLRSYVFPVENGLQELSVSVADGMIVNEPVTIQVPEGMLLSVYLNGQPYNLVGDTIRDIGEYTINTSASGQETKILSFTICGKKTGMITNYSIPTGFSILEATLNGQDVDYTKSFISLEEEGTYNIRYICGKTGIEYVLTVETDHTPPAVVFEGVDEKGRAYGPVLITGKEPTDTIVILKDDKEIKSFNDKLTQSGHYQAWVTDDAMNTVISNFTIMIYLDSNGILFILVILAVIGGFVAYLIWQRKHLRVR